MNHRSQTVTVDVDALRKKLRERGYSPTQIETAIEIFKEEDSSSQRHPSTAPLRDDNR
jgi:hypothetical protein